MPKFVYCERSYRYQMKRTSREWKLKRSEFIEGKVCAWCGSSDFLCVHTPGAFSPAEIRTGVYNLAYARFKEVYRQKYQKFEYILTGKHRHKSHPVWHKASTIHKTEPDHTDLEEQRIEKLVEDKGEGNFKQLYREWLEENGIEDIMPLPLKRFSQPTVNGLRKTELKSLSKRRLKKQKKKVHLLSMQLCCAGAAILQA